MDDNSGHLGGVTNAAQLGGVGNNSMGLNNKQGDGSNNAASHEELYTIPGVLHFIQHEFTRFQIERSQWDVDRAELQAKIAVLLGERKGQESLKSDLIRRIKMLEYALVQERAKTHRLKYGCDPPSMSEVSAPTPDDQNITNDVVPDSEAPFSSVSNVTWRQGRQLLRSYLQEIGYTDTIIDVRSNRVRSLLGLTNGSEQEENINPNVVGGEGMKRANESQGRRTPAKKPQQSMAEAMIMDSEAAVMANFEFLGQADVEMSDDDGISDDIDLVVGNEPDMKTTKRKVKAITAHDGKLAATHAANVTDANCEIESVQFIISMADVDAEAEEVLNELNSFTEGDDNETNADFDGSNYTNRDIRRSMGRGKADDIDAALGLGELEHLTVNNEAESGYEVGNAKDSSYRKTWNAKYTLRSHFDGVRALAFHPIEPVLVTVSEDHTLKLWNLQKTVLTKKSAGLDVEPLYTFRGHTSPVLCLAMSTNGEQCFTGSLDGDIICWNIPGSNIDPYDNYDESVVNTKLPADGLNGHTDAIWGLSVEATNGHLASCSADGSVKIWYVSKLPRYFD